METRQIPVDQIVPSPFQARKSFDAKSLHELAQTIKDRGLENPILVRPIGNRFELIAGERRWRAVKLLGRPTIEARIEVVDDQEAYLRGLVENVQRKDLSALEQSHAYLRLTREPFNLSQDRISQMAGKDQGLISKYLSVAQVGGDGSSNYELFINLGLTHLLELARLPLVQDQFDLAKQANSDNLSAAQLRLLVDQKVGPKTPKNIPDPAPGNYSHERLKVVSELDLKPYIHYLEDPEIAGAVEIQLRGASALLKKIDAPCIVCRAPFNELIEHPWCIGWWTAFELSEILGKREAAGKASDEDKANRIALLKMVEDTSEKLSAVTKRSAPAKASPPTISMTHAPAPGLSSN